MSRRGPRSNMRRARSGSCTRMGWSRSSRTWCSTVPNLGDRHEVRWPAQPVGARLYRHVDTSLTVRPAGIEDVARMARLNVRSQQETYRGLMPVAVLDDPGFLSRPGTVLDRRADRRAVSREPNGRRRAGRGADRDRHVGPALGRRSGVGEAVVHLRARDRPGHGWYRGGRCCRSSSIRTSRWRCGWPIRTLGHRRSTASSASLPTGRPRSRAGCERSAWSAAYSKIRHPVTTTMTCEDAGREDGRADEGDGLENR